jgi:hypothetical protein
LRIDGGESYAKCSPAVGLRAVTPTGGMTADFYSFDMKRVGRNSEAYSANQV